MAETVPPQKQEKVNEYPKIGGKLRPPHSGPAAGTGLAEVENPGESSSTTTEEDMRSLRTLNALVLLGSLAGAIYYSVADNELQGAVVVLLGILYFAGLRHVIPE